MKNELTDKVEDESEDSNSEYYDIIIKPKKIENDNSILYEIEQRILFLIDEAFIQSKNEIIEKVTTLQWFGPLTEKEEFLESIIEYISVRRNCSKYVVNHIEYE